MCIPLAGPVVVDTTLGLSLEPDHLPPAQVQAPISHLKASYLCLILLLSPLWTLRIVGRQCYKMQIKSRWNHFLSKPSKDLYPYRNPLRPSSQLLFLCPVPIPTLPGPSLSHQDLGCLSLYKEPPKSFCSLPWGFLLPGPFLSILFNVSPYRTSLSLFPAWCFLPPPWVPIS